MRLLAFSDLDLSFVPKKVLADVLWQRCIKLALTGKSENQRFGAVLVLANGEFGGEGRNRLLGRGEPFPFRTSFFLHAETSAIGAALLKFGEGDIRGATIYVSGFFVKERRPIIFRRATFTCVRCAKLYPRFGINYAHLTPHGRTVVSGEVALKRALQNQRVRREQKLTMSELRQSISI